MERLLEQRYAIKCCVKFDKTGKEGNDMIKEAYGDGAMARSSVFEWHKLFREGRERKTMTALDTLRPARPTTMCHE